MKATQKLHDIGQSLWLDNITRELLTSGTLRRYRDEFVVTGLTSNPTIFDHALGHGQKDKMARLDPKAHHLTRTTLRLRSCKALTSLPE
jgi:transaldolase